LFFMNSTCLDSSFNYREFFCALWVAARWFVLDD